MLRLGSLFSGSGGFELAATLCGIEPVWAAEVEPYPIAVTRSRFPNMKHLGSVTEVKGNEVEPVEIISFGSPCQDLSVAGKRAGLKHTENGDDETTRSGLFMEAIRIIKEMREATNGEYPRYAIWENVPGAFSSNKGEDFRIVLEEFVKVVEPTAVMPEVPKNGWPYADVYCGDGWSLAYRVFDAQYWGVPQRRRRIYLVADFRGQRAGKVSFEREGLRGYFTQSGSQREAVAGDAESGIGAADCGRISDVIPINTMIATRHKQLGRGTGFGLGEMGDAQFTISAGHEHAVCYALDPESVIGVDGYNQCSTGDVSKSMTAASSDYHHVPLVAYSFDSLASNSMKSKNPNSGCRQVEVSKCLDTTNPDPSKNQGGVAVVEQIPYTLKIRSGCAVDSSGKAAGKGALIQENKAATLAVAQDQYLFQPVCSSGDVAGTLDASYFKGCGMRQGVEREYVVQPILDDQGGSQISVRYDGKSPTLRAEMHGNIPAVMEPVTLEPGIASREGGHIYEGVCGTLRANAGDNQMAVAYSIENHPADSRVNIDDSGKVQTLTSRMGTGGGNVPMVMEPVAYNGENITSPLNKTNPQPGDPCHTLGTDSRNYLVYCLQGNGIDRADTAGCNGKGVREDVSYTLNTIDRPAVAYAETYQKVTGPLMANSHPGSYSGQDAYNDMFVVGKEDVAGVDCRNATEYPEMNGTLQAKANGGFSYNCNQVVRVRYIVRRLTPTECARLQGFPDKWGHPDIKESLNDEEYAFWLNVRNTHAEINGKAVKEYTRDQMLTWYNKLHTDSAEYKLWGNGIALPCALYIMEGIADEPRN